jgi:sortase A
MSAVARLVVAALAASVALGCDTADPRGGRPPEVGRAVDAPAVAAPQRLQPAPEPLKASGPRPSAGRPRDAELSVPALGIRALEVIAYPGHTDDAPGTAIQNRGLAASPFGPRGGTGPGGIGNYQVTAHRTSSTRAFEFLPSLRVGERVQVSAGRRVFVYEIVATRRTSFRSPRSLDEQRAPVPGRPGQAPTKAMITLSTCATPEDHAAGNYWADEFDNPEHRIDKIGVLVATRPG